MPTDVPEAILAQLPDQATIARATLTLSAALVHTIDYIGDHLDRFHRAPIPASPEERCIALILAVADTLTRFSFDANFDADEHDPDRLNGLRVLAGALTLRDEPRNAYEHVLAWQATLGVPAMRRALPHIVVAARETLEAIIRDEDEL